jgi:hypothetical protein
MDEATRNYARTHDQKYEAEVWRINHRLAELRRLAALEDALAGAGARQESSVMPDFLNDVIDEPATLIGEISVIHRQIRRG